MVCRSPQGLLWREKGSILASCGICEGCIIVQREIWKKRRLEYFKLMGGIRNGKARKDASRLF